MAVRHTLTEPFERRGVWWSPGQPDHQVTGIYTFDPKAGSKLDLVGTLGREPVRALLQQFTRPIEQVTIHGVTVDGKKITLARAMQSSSRMHSPGMIVESYVALWCLVGGHFDGIDDECFVRSEVSFEGLDTWIAHSPFRQVAEDDPRSVHLICSPPVDRVVGSLPQMDAEVVVTTTINVQDEPLRRFELTAHNAIGLQCQAMRGAQWHVEQLEHLNRLVALCTGRNLPLTSIRLFGHPIEFAPGQLHANPIEVLFAATAERSGKTDRDPPIYSMAELTSDNARAVARWFEVSENLSPVIDMLFTVIGSRTHVETGFLLTVQALEAHHRLTTHEPIIPREDYDKVKTALLAAIPAQTPKAMRQKLTGTLDFANEPSLQQRLKQTAKALEPTFGPGAFGLDKATIKSIVDNRNYYTHYPERLRATALRGAALYRLTRLLVPLLFFLLLRALDLPEEALKAHLARRRGFL